MVCGLSFNANSCWSVAFENGSSLSICSQQIEWRFCSKVSVRGVARLISVKSGTVCVRLPATWPKSANCPADGSVQSVWQPHSGCYSSEPTGAKNMRSIIDCQRSKVVTPHTRTHRRSHKRSQTSTRCNLVQIRAQRSVHCYRSLDLASSNLRQRFTLFPSVFSTNLEPLALPTLPQCVPASSL